eukprot:TRINITY_DN9986_c0_g1_i1.p1 TRINITY_DN9986_c0_g1~~TRINITY_DN9986_c0_g1_i1.p1  ORF type:complete len:129 (-),score=19.94 TRINITY_DN9986_c0_g1_i1:131-487(-)
MEEAFEMMSNVTNGKGSSAHAFLTWVYIEYPPKKDNATLPDGFSPFSSPIDTKSALKKAMPHEFLMQNLDCNIKVKRLRVLVSFKRMVGFRRGFWTKSQIQKPHDTHPKLLDGANQVC